MQTLLQNQIDTIRNQRMQVEALEAETLAHAEEVQKQ